MTSKPLSVAGALVVTAAARIGYLADIVNRAMAFNLKILVFLNRVNQEAQHVNAILLIGFNQKCMQRRGASACVNLGFYCRQPEVW